MTLRQIKKQITMSHNKLIQMLYDYVDEHQSNRVVNINLNNKYIQKSQYKKIRPVQLHNYDTETYVSYISVFESPVSSAIKEKTDTADCFTLGELTEIIKMI